MKGAKNAKMRCTGGPFLSFVFFAHFAVILFLEDGMSSTSATAAAVKSTGRFFAAGKVTGHG